MSDAAAMLTEAANQGHMLAQATIGDFFLSGVGVVQDLDQAFEFTTKAAQKGHAPSQYNLGIMYRNGYGTPPSSQDANTWFLKATEQEYFTAYSALAESHLHGWGTPPNIKRAVELYKLGAAHGSHQSFTSLYKVSNLYEAGRVGRPCLTSSSSLSSIPR